MSDQEIRSRTDGRQPNTLRPIRFQNGIAPHAAGSTLISWGQTQVICAVTIDDDVPRWMKEQKVAGGWLTAEYSMLPYSTLSRKPRDSSRGRIDGRSQEIQRLIGRSLRAAIDLPAVGSRTFWIDCDVLQADGGTRTAAITGSYVALRLAIKDLLSGGALKADPMRSSVAAVSVGLVDGVAMTDLCYTEDVAATVDMNIVMNGDGEYIEVQGTGEEATYSHEQLQALLGLARESIEELKALQDAAVDAVPS